MPTRRVTKRKTKTPSNRPRATPKKSPRKKVEESVQCSKLGRTWKVRSGFEARMGKLLDDAGCEFTYESVKLRYVELIPRGKCDECGSTLVYKERTYTPDFVVKRPGNFDLYIECKGKLDLESKRKYLGVINSNPELDIRFIFQRDNWLTKAHRKRYSEWAEELGYPWAINEVPDEWLE